MNNTIQYKGYVGSVEFSEDYGIFYGKVMGIRSLISYESENAQKLFTISTVLWMTIWKSEGKESEVAFKCGLTIQLSPELHKTPLLRMFSKYFSPSSRQSWMGRNAIIFYLKSSQKLHKVHLKSFPIFLTPLLILYRFY